MPADYSSECAQEQDLVTEWLKYQKLQCLWNLVLSRIRQYMEYFSNAMKFCLKLILQ